MSKGGSWKIERKKREIGIGFIDKRKRVEKKLGMKMRSVKKKKIEKGINKELGEIKEIREKDGWRRGEKKEMRIIGGIRVKMWFLNIIESEEKEEKVIIVKEKKFLDKMRMKKEIGLVMIEVLMKSNKVLKGNKLIDFMIGIGRKKKVEVGKDKEEKERKISRILKKRNEGNEVWINKRMRIGKSGIG